MRRYNFKGTTYPNESAVGVLEVKDRGPVVGLVLGETTSRAGGMLRGVSGRVHGEVEGILK